MTTRDRGVPTREPVTNPQVEYDRGVQRNRERNREPGPNEAGGATTAPAPS